MTQIVEDSNPPFRISRDPWGRLDLTFADGVKHNGVEPKRAFPIEDPNHWIIFNDVDGREVVCLESIDALSVECRALVLEELKLREFMPEILRILTIRGESTPSDWDVITDHGPVRFLLDNDDDVRKISQNRVIITELRKTRYQVSNIARLDSMSRKLLERYL